MKTFSEYKDSNDSWVGAIPAHWDILRGKLLFGTKKEINIKNKWTNVLSLTLRGVVNNNPDDPEGLVPKDYATYQFFKKDDLVFKLIDLENYQTSRVGLVHEDGIMSPAYVRVFSKAANNIKYFYYYYFTLYQQGVYNNLGAGVRSTLNATDLLEVPVPVPPRAEQDAIASFLDSKLADIDRYISEKKRLIELLQEQKTAIINQAVTKGLNPQVGMKDSGIEWLGEIPSHWEVMKLARLADSLQTGPFGSQLHQSDYVEGGRPSINPLHMINGRIVPDLATSIDEKTFERLQRHALEEGDVIFARRGEMGRCALVTSKEVGWLCGTGSLLMRPKKNIINAGYLVLVFLNSKISEHLSLMSVGSTMENLNTGILARLDLPILPLSEQQKITDFVEKTSMEIDTAINKTYDEIELVQEYRTALIAEAVTGKIDVR